MNRLPSLMGKCPTSRPAFRLLRALTNTTSSLLLHLDVRCARWQRFWSSNLSLLFSQSPSTHTSHTMSAAALLARASGRLCLQSLRARESVATPAVFGALSRYYASKCMHLAPLLQSKPLTACQCSFPPSHRHQHARPVTHHDRRQHWYLAEEGW